MDLDRDGVSTEVMKRQVSILESILAGAAPSEYLSAAAELIERFVPGSACEISLSGSRLSVRGTGSRFARSPAPETDGCGLRVVPVINEERVMGEVFVVLRPDRPLTPEEDLILKQAAHLGSVAAQREQSLADLEYQATHDSLTKLANRNLFIDHVDHALARGRRIGNRTAILFLDLDRFKVINDSLGHSGGDTLLKQVAERLRIVVRAEDTIARFGGDEFVILCQDLGSANEAVGVAQRVLSAVSGTYSIEGQKIHVSASIGVAVDHGALDTADMLLRDADAAMYDAKRAGRGVVHLFESTSRSEVTSRLRTENALREAVTHQGITVVYQPLIRLSDDRLVGVEALARWKDRPDVAPEDFVAMAEDMGIISALGRAVLKTVSSDFSRWDELTGNDRLFVSVNLSAQHLADPELIPLVKAALRRGGIDPARLCLEITEGTLIDDAKHGHHLEDLKRLGVRLAIDDFGTGYSSFSYLTRLHVDLLKVDRSLVQGLGLKDDDAAILSAVGGLAHDLGIDSVAEGIENPAQRDALRAMGYDIGQGFLWAKPVSQAKIGQLLQGKT